MKIIVIIIIIFLDPRYIWSQGDFKHYR